MRSNYMWASDYPHLDSTMAEFAHGHPRRTFAHVPEETVKKIVYGNVAKLYQLG